jgi:hypothetical protein
VFGVLVEGAANGLANAFVLPPLPGCGLLRVLPRTVFLEMLRHWE